MTIPGPEPHLDSFHQMLAAAREIETHARRRTLPITEAETIAQKHGVDLGQVLGHLSLVESCKVDYARGTIQCRR